MKSWSLLVQSAKYITTAATIQQYTSHTMEKKKREKWGRVL